MGEDNIIMDRFGSIVDDPRTGDKVEYKNLFVLDADDEVSSDSEVGASADENEAGGAAASPGGLLGKQPLTLLRVEQPRLELSAAPRAAPHARPAAAAASASPVFGSVRRGEARL